MCPDIVQGVGKSIMRMPSKFRFWFTIGYVALILVSSILPGDGETGWGFDLVANINPTVQNLLHVPVYALLAISVEGVLRDRKKGSWQYTIVIIFCLFFGILNEVIQIPIPGRYAGLGDILLNVAGAFLGIAAIWIGRRLRGSH